MTSEPEKAECGSSKGQWMILGAVLCWGIAYPIAKWAMDPANPGNWASHKFAFLAMRFWLAFLVMYWLLGGKNTSLREYIWPGFLIGSTVVIAFGFQYWAFSFPTTVTAKVAFLCALGAVFVPLGYICTGKWVSVSRNAMIAIPLALCGTFLLTWIGLSPVSSADLLALISAVGFAADIVVVGHFKQRGMQSVGLLTYEFLVLGVMCTGISLTLEIPSGLPPVNLSITLSILFMSLIATGLAFYLQTEGQATTSNIKTALLFATDPLFVAFFGFLVLGETLTVVQILGGVLIAVSLAVLELPDTVALRRATESKRQAAK